MTESNVPAGARAIAAQWRALDDLTGDGTFEPSMCDHLPPGARRWLGSAIRPGAQLARRARLSMDGEILLKAWRPFSAEQIIVPGRGFIWSARTRVGGLPVSGFDRFTGGDGEMRWKLGGLVPVMTAQGPDVTRSAAGRLAAESVLVPTACICEATRDLVTWDEIDDSRIGLSWTLPGGEVDHIVLEISDAGAPIRVTMQRWGNPFERGYGRYGFVVELSEQCTFDGISIPTVWSARWEDADAGMELEFFRAAVSAASYR